MRLIRQSIILIHTPGLILCFVSCPLLVVVTNTSFPIEASNPVVVLNKTLRMRAKNESK